VIFLKVAALRAAGVYLYAVHDFLGAKIIILLIHRVFAGRGTSELKVA
jgi:hypothetical protein